MCLYIDAGEHELGDLGEPTNYKAALLDPEFEKWLNVMNVEIQSMKENEVWVLVELPPNGKTVGSKWLLKKKTDMDGNQASSQWNKRFDDEIKKFGFTQNHDESCVYLRASGSNITFLILYFAMKDLGKAAYILGIKIYIDRSRRLIGLCQSAYIEKIVKRYCMKSSKRRSIPMQEKLKFSKSQGASTPAELKRVQNVLYASAVGPIMYAVRCTRPDVTFAQNVTSRFQQNPRDIHWTTVKNILKYFRNTKDTFLVYRGDLKRELGVSCYLMLDI
nr:hypothetical protein [Tanacetum cinerariifolium]